MERKRLIKKDLCDMPGIPILVVDDEVSLVEGLQVFLEDEGYTVYSANDGRQGLEMFRSCDPTLVLTDLRMPGLSGMELITEIRKIKAQTPIIVLTGYGSLECAIDAIRHDVFDFMTKPLDLDCLKATLDRARNTVRTTLEVQEEIESLREQLTQFQKQWAEQFSKFSEVEPLIHAGRLVAGVLHNLNNPLTYIMGQAELLQLLHPEVENVAKIGEQAKRMKGIMASVTRKIRNIQVRESHWFQLDDLLKEEVAFLESHPHLGVELTKEWQLAADFPPLFGVVADFSQILGNILRNAVEAMEGCAAKRLIFRTWYDNSEIHLSIQDTGPGVPSHVRERIFEAFFTTKTGELSVAGGMGMGIGLFYCRELMLQYGGRIEVANAEPRGAVFSIHLPRSRSHDQHD